MRTTICILSGAIAFLVLALVLMLGMVWGYHDIVNKHTMAEVKIQQYDVYLAKTRRALENLERAVIRRGNGRPLLSADWYNAVNIKLLVLPTEFFRGDGLTHKFDDGVTITLVFVDVDEYKYEYGETKGVEEWNPIYAYNQKCVMHISGPTAEAVTAARKRIGLK